jgi:hypothetical protein
MSDTQSADPKADPFVDLGKVEALTGHGPNGNEDDGGSLDGQKLQNKSEHLPPR